MMGYISNLLECFFTPCLQLCRVQVCSPEQSGRSVAGPRLGHRGCKIAGPCIIGSRQLQRPLLLGSLLAVIGHIPSSQVSLHRGP
jgi:hypothetical protein